MPLAAEIAGLEKVPLRRLEAMSGYRKRVYELVPCSMVVEISESCLTDIILLLEISHACTETVSSEDAMLCTISELLKVSWSRLKRFRTREA